MCHNLVITCRLFLMRVRGLSRSHIVKLLDTELLLAKAHFLTES